MKRRINVSKKHLVKAVALKMAARPIEALELARTVPEYCTRQGWPEGELRNGIREGHAFVGAALACYAAGAIHQALRVPAFLKLHPTWAALCAEHGDVVAAAHVVECLSPGALPVGHADRLDTLLGIEAKREILPPA